MFKRIICAMLVALLGFSLYFTAGRTSDYLFGAEYEGGAKPEETTGVVEDENTLVLWYTDDALTEFLTSEGLLFQKETGTKVEPVLVSGVEFLENINSASLTDISDRRVLPPDVYITTHDTLLRAYLSGLAIPVKDAKDFLTSSNFPQTAVNAVTCYNNYVGYPLYYETNYFLYNKTYMASIAQNRIESESDIAEGEASQAEVDNSAEKPKESKILEPEDIDKENEEDNDDEASDSEKEGSETADDGGAEGDAEEGFEEGPMGEEDALASPEVLERLSTMIPATIDDITTFANNYDAPEAVESVFEWDVSDIFYNYFFVGNYMEVGGPAGDNTAIFNIYNQQAVDCLSVFQSMNQFFSIDADSVSYDDILDDFIQGKTVFTVATTDAVAKIEKAKAEGNFNFEYGVTVLPDISSLLKARGLSVTTVAAVNGYSTKTDKASEFARYLCEQKSPDLYKKAGKISCKKGVQYENSEINNIMDEYEKSMPLPKMVEASNYWVQLEIAMTKIWDGADPDETLTQLSETMGAQIEAIRASLPTQESFLAGASSLIK